MSTQKYNEDIPQVFGNCAAHQQINHRLDHKGNEIIFLAELYENTAYQYLWDAAKTVLGRKFTELNSYIRKEEISTCNDQS